MVDTLTRTGIDRYFINEIENALDTTYRYLLFLSFWASVVGCFISFYAAILGLTFLTLSVGKHRSWVQGDEEIFLDTSTCAMAFRLLRVNGYSVSSGRSSD